MLFTHTYKQNNFLWRNSLKGA